MLWLLSAGCLGQSRVSCGTYRYFETPLYTDYFVCVCIISQAKKKRQQIKEPPWISMNAFTVIKHSSEIQHRSGRRFPLQSCVLLRASMGFGLTLIFFFLWLIRSGVYYSCKYFCVWSFELRSSRKAEERRLITAASRRGRVWPRLQPQPSLETSALPQPSLALALLPRLGEAGGGKDRSSYCIHLCVTVAHSLFCPVWC